MGDDQFGSIDVGLGVGDMGSAIRLFDPQQPTESDRTETLEEATARYLDHTEAARRGRAEYVCTLRKWAKWRNSHRSYTPMRVSDLNKQVITEFCDWVYEQAKEKASNPGRVANKARTHLRAVLSWLVTRGDMDILPTFPADREQRSQAGLHYLVGRELDALYWATFRLPRPRGWEEPYAIGAYWRAALVAFFTYGCDTQTIFPYEAGSKALRWRDVFWTPECPDRTIGFKEANEWGWLFYTRSKTGRVFIRPMSREVRLHLESIKPASPQPEDTVFRGGSSRPCERFQELVELAGVAPKRDFHTGKEVAWTLKDLRKTSATEHEENLPGSAVAILGHAATGVTYKHYANREPLAFRAVMSLKYPEAMRSIWDDRIRPPGMLFAT